VWKVNHGRRLIHHNRAVFRQTVSSLTVSTNRHTFAGLSNALTRSTLNADKEIKLVLEKRGYTFHTDTDTEAVAVLCKYIYDSQPNKRLNFTDLIKAVIKELVRDTCIGQRPFGKAR
jgi:hypothetical protein